MLLNHIRAYLAELIGTFALVFVGTSTAVLTTTLGLINPVAIALSFGLIFIVMAFSMGQISGAHLNPAVSLGFAIRKDITWKDFGFYVLFQLVGAFIASLLLGLFLGSFSNLAATDLSPVISNPPLLFGLLIEIVLTFLFVSVILAVTAHEKYKPFAGIFIGLTLVAIILAGINFTGAGYNPARSIAPALLQGGSALTNVWLYIVGPFVGSLLAAYLHLFLFKNQKESK